MDNPNPVVHRDGRLVQTSKQITAYLLCRTCEDSLGRDENYASSLAFSWETPGPILQNLIEPPLFDARIAGYRRRLHSTKNLEVARLVRFALSVFWRSAIAKVPGAEGARLGKKYEELFRSYLHGEAGVPEEARLVFAVLDPGTRRFHGMAAYPWSFRDRNCWHHRFVIWGLVFELYLSQAPPDFLTALCFARTGRALQLPGEVVGAVKVLARSVRLAQPSAHLARSEAAYRNTR